MATTFTINDRTSELIEDLKKRLNASSKSEVIRRAIALLEVASEAEQEGGYLQTVNPKKDEKTRVILK